MTADKPIVIYDIGARGRLQDHWHKFAIAGDPRFSFILFDPAPDAARELRRVYQDCASVTVIEKAVLHRAGYYPLNVTAHSTCSSILEPNFAVLDQYAIAPIFRVVNTELVFCDRLDTIVHLHQLPRPDFVKIDVQGAEYLVLLGMGDLLSSCLALEMEAHFYPIYKNEKVVGEINEYVANFGIYLNDIRPQHHFDYDYVEVNLYYGRGSNSLDSNSADRLAFIRQILEIKLHPQGASIAA